MLSKGYFKLARNISKGSDHKIRVGAVLCNKKPISACSNRQITHPKYADPSITIIGSLHAEVRTIINCESKDLKNSVMYIYRETRAGKPALARPCKYCMELLKEVGVKRIYYTIDIEPYWRTERI